MKILSNVEQAQIFIKDNDQNRTAFIESFYGVKWDQASAFDLVFDTGKVSPELVTNFLIASVRNMERKRESGDRVVANTPVDPVLYSSICKA